MASRVLVCLVGLLWAAGVASAQTALPAVPPGAVAQVGTVKTITRAELDHWIDVSAAASNDPAPRESTTAWRDLATRAAIFLIDAGWILGEAAERDVVASDGAVRRRFQAIREKNFPDARSYERFLRTSGHTEDDLLLRVRLELTAAAVRASVVRGVPPTTRTERLAYYRTHRGQLATPELRHVRFVLTRTLARARAARSARRAGRSWAAVASKYSEDEETRGEGGATGPVARSDVDVDIRGAFFTAKRGALWGPVKTGEGYYVYEITRIRAGRPARFTRVEATIRELLLEERRRAAHDRFSKDYRNRWRARTACALPTGVEPPLRCGA